MADRARQIAIDALSDRKGNVSARLARLLDEADLPPAGRGLATELALGCVQRRRTLEAVLRAYLARPKKPLPPRVGHILHVAIYQMLVLDRVPTFAAVNEAVEAVRRSQPKLVKLANGVLRAIGRDLSEPLPGRAPATRRAVPIDADRHRTFARDILPDPTDQPAEHLAIAASLPDAMVRRWIDHFGRSRAEGLALAANAHPPLICRVNTLRADRQAVLASLAGQDVAARPHQDDQAVVIEGHVHPDSLDALRQGLIQPQDPTAIDVARQVRPAPGQDVLDFCAAPGTKTTHLAELMQNRGAILAMDVSEAKLSRIEESCRRMGVEMVTTALAASAGGLELGRFDVALVDAPCSNTGVLARRPEARWRFDPDDLTRLADDQRFLLTAAAALVKPGGRLVYSTCSVEPEENEQVSKWLQRQGRARLVRDRLTLPAETDEPTRWHDGGYVAIFELR